VEEEISMMRTVQLAMADSVYAAALRDALGRSGPWHVEMAERPDTAFPGVLVLDESAFASLALPLENPGRVVLITRRNPQLLAEAWDAGIVSVVSAEDPVSTALLAIMAAALRAAKSHVVSDSGGISPRSSLIAARIPPENRNFRPKRCKTP
jgi:hypothetical protein